MAKDIILKPGTFTSIVTSKSVAQGAIPGASLEKFFVNLLKNPTCCAKYVVLSKGTITQGTSVSTAVTLNFPAGKITMFGTLTTAANTDVATFTVNNNYVKADSLVLANVVDQSTSGGFPVVFVDDITTGSFKVTVRNASSTTAFASCTLTIGFSIM
jgi:hypothetical protein